MADIITRSPFADLNSRLNRLFDDGWMRSLLPAELEDGTLAVDVAESDTEITVRASLPGFTQDQIDVSLDSGVLSIKASREEEHEEKGERFYRKERYAGSVSRRVALPGAVADASAVEAELDNGVLTVHVPRAEKAQPKKIEIKTAG